MTTEETEGAIQTNGTTAPGSPCTSVPWICYGIGILIITEAGDHFSGVVV